MLLTKARFRIERDSTFTRQRQQEVPEYHAVQAKAGGQRFLLAACSLEETCSASSGVPAVARDLSGPQSSRLSRSTACFTTSRSQRRRQAESFSPLATDRRTQSIVTTFRAMVLGGASRAWRDKLEGGAGDLLKMGKNNGEAGFHVRRGQGSDPRSCQLASHDPATRLQVGDASGGLEI